MTDTTTTLRAWDDMMGEAAQVGEALNLSPCEALAYAFPAIVKNDEVMGALAAILDPVMASVAPLVVMGIVPADVAEEFIHNVFHTLQIAAALGHMIGVDEATGAVVDIPGDLSEIAWDDLPDVTGGE